MRRQRGTHRLAPPGQQMQHLRRQAGGVEQAHRLGGNQGRLLGGLCHDGIARRQRRGNLAGEDGERKIPGRDAGEDAAAMQLQRIGFADGSFQDRGARELTLRQQGIVAAEIRRLPHFAHRVGPGLARFAHRQRDQAVAMLFQRVGHGAQDAGAVGAAARVPSRLRLGGGGEGGVDLGLAGFGAVADFG